MVVKSDAQKERIKNILSDLLILELEIYEDLFLYTPETEFTPAISCISEILKNVEVRR